MFLEDGPPLLKFPNCLTDLDKSSTSARFYRDCMQCKCNARYCCCNSVCLSVRLSVRLSDACIVTKLNDALRILSYHTKRQSL